MKRLRPFWKYYGGKWRAAPLYPPPAHRTIIEPFAGAAGYSLLYHDRDVVLIERDPVVAATWRYLVSVSAEEIRSIPLLRGDQTVDDLVGVCQEARYLVGWWVNTGTVQPCKRPSAWMRKGDKAYCFWGESVRERIASQVDLIRHWRVVEADYRTAPEVEATWFIDPPYDGAGRYYKAQPGSFVDLGMWCRSRRGQVIVCENEGATWLPFRHLAHIKATTSRSGARTSNEAIWTNDAEDA